MTRRIVWWGVGALALQVRAKFGFRLLLAKHYPGALGAFITDLSKFSANVQLVIVEDDPAIIADIFEHMPEDAPHDIVVVISDPQNGQCPSHLIDNVRFTADPDNIFVDS